MLITLIVFLFIILVLSVGFFQRKPEIVSYEININNIDKNKSLRWYEKEVKSQINCLLFSEEETKDGVVKYKSPLIYSVNEEYMYVEYNLFYIKIESSKTIQRVISNLVEIDFKE